MATNGSKSEGDGARPESEVLDVRDVLLAIPVDASDSDSLGALLTFRTDGDHTVVSVDPNGAGSAAAVQIATLQGITDITLQQLLSTNLDIAC